MSLGTWEFFPWSSGSPASTWDYYGGYLVFADGTAAASTWTYHGGYLVFGNGSTGVASTWAYRGGYLVWGDAVTTSTSAAAGVGCGRLLITVNGLICITEPLR